MNRNIVFLIVFISLISVSQEISETYLASLPDDVKEDVLNRIEEKEKSEAPVYRKASTMIDKDIGTSGIFGESFFDTMSSTFMPINEPNLDGSYMLDFGDELEIQLIGQEDFKDNFSIKRDGTITLPNIGKISISGLSLDDASSMIKAKVSKAYIGTEAYISLVNVRDIKVLISGNAYNPGVYTLNGNSNMLHAISMAGGINEIGSYRSIRLIRNNKVISSIDIYDLLIKGINNDITKLRSGDTIFVDKVGKVISIESGVLRPGKYEMKDDESFGDLVTFANGISLLADKDNIILKRISGPDSISSSIEYSKIVNMIPEDGDSLFIREYKFNEVEISGAVVNPGTYLFPIGTKLSEVIISAGGYANSAYPFGGFLNNLRSSNINEQSKEKLYETFINNLVTKSYTYTDTEGLGLVLQQIKDAEVSGRIIAEFDLDVLRANPELDTIIEDKDDIYIPYVTQQVYIQGEVSNPGAVRYSPNQDVSYYIGISGGALESSDLDTIFIIHPNGETSNISRTTRLSFIQSQNKSNLIYPGSIIFIPRDANFGSRIETASVWAPIISSLALSITSLSVLNNSN